MLTHLTIQDLALVRRVDLPLGAGLNVLTGETGAGKSVLVGALSLVLGGRARSDIVRAGASQGVVEALLEAPAGSELARRLEGHGIDAPDGQLLVRRTIGGAGRGRVLLNGQMATVSMLAEILRGVVELTGQHEHVTLLDPERHLDIVDAFGNLQGLRTRCEEAYGEVHSIRASLRRLDTDEAERTRREDYLRFVIDEIRGIDPQPGELERLEAERKRLRGAVELSSVVRQAELSLYSGDGAVVETVGRVLRELSRMAPIDAAVESLAGRTAGLLAELEELARDLVQYGRGLDAEPGRLEDVEDRIEQLRRLCRKHGGSVEGVLAAHERMVQELDDLVHDETRRGELSAALEVALEHQRTVAAELTAARKKASRGLVRGVQKELAELSMAGTRLEIQRVPLMDPGPRGAESMEILIQPNPGEPMRALRKIASGGELSRVLLAVKNVLAGGSALGAQVFDEVDSGIGGAIAEVLGGKLKAAARNTQVLVVTHLPQVAAYADRHFVVSKAEVDGRTLTSVCELAEAERIEELARMVGGVEITAKTRGLARELRARGRSEARRGLVQRRARAPGARSRPAAKGGRKRALEVAR